MITRWLRFVNGMLKISVEGSNLSRFFNLCAGHEITFWDVSYVSKTKITCRMRLFDLYQLRPYLKKTKTRLRIEQKIGIPFFVNRYRARKIYAAVLVFAAIAVWMLGTRIWRIEIRGNASLGEDTILEYLKTHEITYGVPAKEIDNDALELSLRKDFDPVIWASVYEEGTRLVVCLQEKIAVNDPKTDSGVCTDLVATKDAKIASIITRGGTPCVKKGDSVKKGDVLVLGRQEILDDNGEVREYYYQSADADVYGYTWYSYEDSIPKEMQVTSPTGEKSTQYLLQIMNERFLTPALHAEYEKQQSIAQTRQLCLAGSFYLPVYYGKITTEELTMHTASVSKEKAKTLATTHFLQFLSDLEENGVRIVDKNVMIEQMEKNYHIYGKVKACEKITASSPTEMKRKEPVNESE